MIPVTRLDGTRIVLNIDLVQWIEQTPDTLVSLTNGERIIVREMPEEIVRRAVAFRREIACGPDLAPGQPVPAGGC